MRTFLDDADREGFLDSVSSLVEDGALVVHAYCLMPNHDHLLCETPEADLARWIGTRSR